MTTPAVIDQNKSTVRRYLDQAVSRGSNTAMDELVSPDVVFSSPYTPEPIRGIEGFKQMIGMLHAAFPDLKIHEAQTLAEGDTVASRWTATGTHRGGFMGHPASRRKFSITGISIYRLKDGKIAEGWVNDDSMGMLQQLGLLGVPA